MTYLFLCGRSVKCAEGFLIRRGLQGGVAPPVPELQPSSRLDGASKELGSFMCLEIPHATPNSSTKCFVL